MKITVRRSAPCPHRHSTYTERLPFEAKKGEKVQCDDCGSVPPRVGWLAHLRRLVRFTRRVVAFFSA